MKKTIFAYFLFVTLFIFGESFPAKKQFMLKLENSLNKSDESDTENVFRCLVCGEVFTIKDEWLKHLLLEVKKMKLDESTVISKEEETIKQEEIFLLGEYECPNCFQVFSTEYDLVDHMVDNHTVIPKKQSSQKEKDSHGLLEFEKNEKSSSKKESLQFSEYKQSSVGFRIGERKINVYK